MKKLVFALGAIVLMGLSFASCDNKPDPKPIPQPEEKGNLIELFANGKQLGDGKQEYTVKKGDWLLKKGTYLLKGFFYISEGTTLTIEPGTVIKGDKDTKASIIVQRGGKLIAKGTATQPIVFTSAQPAGSRRPGDWGGIILCGKAINNQGEASIEGGVNAKHGGNDNADNSGILSYVRIEFAGYPYQPDNEINGLTLGSVGSGTQIDHVQVSYSNDDSFEWFGGTVNCNHLIAYMGWDDDFDTDFGFSGNVQFCLGVRNPRIADTSWSNGFESDNDGKGSTKTPWTSAKFSNVTSIGPMASAADFANTADYINGGGMDPKNGAKLGTFLSGAQIRRNSHLNICNSVFIGWPVGLIIENDKGSTTQKWALDGTMNFKNNVFAGNGIIGTDVNKKTEPVWSDNSDNKEGRDKKRTPFSEEYFKNPANGNQMFQTIAELGLTNCNALDKNFDPRPAAGSKLLGGANFGNMGALKPVPYIGAFAQGDNWMDGWTNFDPQHTQY